MPATRKQLAALAKGRRKWKKMSCKARAKARKGGGHNKIKNKKRGKCPGRK